ncbi:hypothetical protein WMY93_014432 [Mugilogobius chulae]|uniref:BZIP domain-containing protein n=1 Tax=Mugilogobius chulae TaxID=88201 RepID=A0AAW0P4F4_9GOBI
MQRPGTRATLRTGGESAREHTGKRAQTRPLSFLFTFTDLNIGISNRMMLQHSGPSLADISCSALVPCLSPPGTLTLDDFTGFSPLVKEELRLTIQSKRVSSGLSADVSSDGASSSSERMSEHLLGLGASGGNAKRVGEEEEATREKQNRCRQMSQQEKEKTETLQKESEKLETVNAELKAQIEELKQQKQQLVYMLNLHRPTCIVRAQNGRTPEDERNLFIQHIKESALQLQSLTSSMSLAVTTATDTPTNSIATTTIDAGLLSLEHVHCL